MGLGIVRVFVEVVAPVFAIVALGWVIGPRLGLEARTLARAAYHVFVPAFTFHVISSAQLPAGRAARLAGLVVVTHLAFGALGWAAARLLRRPREVTAAYVMLAVFGNVGNYGLALLDFRLGPGALVPATVWFVVSLLVSFVVCVGAAAWVRGGKLTAAFAVLRTPAILAAIPAAILSAAGLAVPLPLARGVGLLADAMVPVMLFTLGLQLAATGGIRLGVDVAASGAIRLLAAPAVAWLLAAPLGVAGIDRQVAILQAAMPPAVLVAIIATEHDVVPRFVMSAVFFCTLASLPVLTLLLALL